MSVPAARFTRPKKPDGAAVDVVSVWAARDIVCAGLLIFETSRVVYSYSP